MTLKDLFWELLTKLSISVSRKNFEILSPKEHILINFGYLMTLRMMIIINEDVSAGAVIQTTGLQNAP